MKKNLILMAAICAITFTVKGQTEKGKFSLGGSFGYSTTKNENNNAHGKQIEFIVSPKMGYFISDNFSIGTNLSYSANKSKNVNIDYAGGSPVQNSGYRNSSFGISPFARYYINLSDNFRFFSEFALSGETGKLERLNVEGTDYTKEYNFKNYGVNLSPGLAFFPAKKWAIEFFFPLIGYQKTTTSNAVQNLNNNDNEAFQFGLDTFTPSIGVNFHF